MSSGKSGKVASRAAESSTDDDDGMASFFIQQHRRAGSLWLGCTCVSLAAGKQLHKVSKVRHSF